MKEVIGVIIFFLLAMTVGGGISAMFFTSIVGGGVSESYLYPIYGGIVLLAGLIAICTAVILEKIKERFPTNIEIEGCLLKKVVSVIVSPYLGNRVIVKPT